MGLLNQAQQSYYDGNNHGDYQFVSLKNIINQFMMVYVGEDKIIPSAKRLDVAFHAQRALAELSFDTFKSCKSQEITVPATLQMILPQDYVNYTKISWVDSAGIKHLMYPTSKTSNPSFNPLQNSDGEFKLQAIGAVDDDTDPSNTGKIILDGEYNDIVYGMYIDGPFLSTPNTNMQGNPWQVINTSTSSGITTLTVGFINAGNTPDTAVQPDNSFNPALLTFTSGASGDVVSRRKTVVVAGVSTVLNHPEISSTTASFSDVEVGMLVHHKNFPAGTTVLYIESVGVTKNIFVSNPANKAEIGIEIRFSSDDVDTSTWANYKSSTPSENQDDYQDDTYWPANGERYGLDPQHAQANGSFYIDCVSGKIHFSSNVAGKTVVLDYISDSLGTDAEMQVHKFAEEAMYKWMAHAILSGKANIPEYQVNRFKKERFAAIRTAKLRLSNIKLEEITQILRGKSKQIKH